MQYNIDHLRFNRREGAVWRCDPLCGSRCGSGSGFPGDTGVQGAAGDRVDPDSLPDCSAHPWTQVNRSNIIFDIGF